MDHDKDERKRAHLRLVVNNPDTRVAAPDAAEQFIPLEELLADIDSLRPQFYRDISPLHAKAYRALERFFTAKGWRYGLDPHHGTVLVMPAETVCPAIREYAPQDELLVFVADDPLGNGLSLSLEMILPFYDEDQGVMEEALLYGPILQFGTLFLEENRHDGFLDLIYRISFPLHPPAATARLLEKFFALAGFELAETLRTLAEYPQT